MNIAGSKISALGKRVTREVIYENAEETENGEGLKNGGE